LNLDWLTHPEKEKIALAFWEKRFIVRIKKAIQYVRQTDIDSIRYPELVMKLANTQNGIITKQDVIELLKVSPSQAYTVIKKLQGEGRLKLLCGGKYSKYKVVNS